MIFTPDRGSHGVTYLLLLFSIPLVNSVTIDCSLAVSIDTLYPLENLTNGISIDYSQYLDLTKSTAGELCTLSRTVETVQNENVIYHPLGRSYNGYDWERVAGPGKATLSYECTGDTCRITIPPPEAGESYLLARYTHSLSTENEISRFLHRTTWGPTKEEIANFEGSQAAYVHDQIYNVNASLHRAYFRRRAGARALQMTKAALAGPKPCESGSRYRKYAFTQQDLYLSKERTKTSTFNYGNPMYLVEASTVTNGVDMGYLLSFAGYIRTILDEPFIIEGGSMNGTEVDMNTSYRLCLVDEIEGSARNYPDKLGIYYPDINGIERCMFIKGGNPSVNLDPRFYDTNSVHMLDLSNLSHEDLSVVNGGATAPGTTAGGIWRLNAEINDEAACSGLPDPYDNDYRDKTDAETGTGLHPNWGNSSIFALDAPVFALLPDGTYAIHDTVLLLQENTMEAPLADGGGTATLRSATKADDGNFAMVKNSRSPDNPSSISGEEQAVWCSNDEPTFVNEESCYLSFEPNACIRENKDHEDIKLAIILDDTTLSNMFSLTGRHVYAVTGIVFDPEENMPPRREGQSTPLVYPPCAENGIRAFDQSYLEASGQARVLVREYTRSRWIPVDQTECDLPSVSIDASTISTLALLLSKSTDINPFVRDIVIWKTGPQCHPDDRNATEMAVNDNNGTCWKNVHPEYLSIYDMTSYVTDYTAETQGIVQNSDTGLYDYSTDVTINSSMAHWEEICEDAMKLKDRKIGRYGDMLEINGLVEKMKVYKDLIANGHSKEDAREVTDQKTLSIANALGEPQLETQMTRDGNGGGVLVCGNPGEVAPDPDIDDTFNMKNLRTDENSALYGKQRRTVWTMLALEAPDQLRQRMAWALNKILNIGTSLTVDSWNTETYLFLYDIYVRHAFGNYFGILKEMSFNPKMAEQMTFVNNRAIRVKWDHSGYLQFPDENYAREIMQLFSTGLHKLNMDGTPKLDENGLPLRVYETHHILTFARVWTGLFYGVRRGNVEELDHSTHTRMDVLRFNANDHDYAPKRDLNGGWIGDRVALCTDLPDQPFLKLGAKFVLLGSQSDPRMQWVARHKSWEGDLSVQRFVLRSNHSKLYQKLCASDGTKCTYPPVIKLNENLDCDDAECRVDMVRVVQVEPGVFYEYIRQPCTQLAFYSNAMQVNGKGNRKQMCANPAMAVATRTCCGRWPWTPWNPNRFDDYAVYHEEREFHGELVKYATNDALCNRLSGYTCPATSDRAWFNDPVFDEWSLDDHYPAYNVFHWSNGPCALKLKVRVDGLAAIIHEPGYVKHNVITYVNENTHNFFSIPWNIDQYTLQEVFPTSENNCGGDNTCILQSDNTCLCNVDVNDIAVFNSIPQRNDILRELYIGAWDPSIFGDYVLAASSADVEVYSPASESIPYSTSTVFKIMNEFGETIFLKNIRSEIQIGGTYTIRNMPHFMDMVAPEIRDAHHEVDAVINHLVRHESTAPNICMQLIKHFGISNPSPRYVETVATAFRDGIYVYNDGTGNISFGDNKVGNLAATAAAIILDREATSPILDADPSHGSLREPILKVISVMRSLGYTRTTQDKMIYPILDGMASKIGQMVYDAPAQFSFFSPDYSPPGQFSASSLVSPESELLTVSYTVGIINGMFSLTRQGLSTMDGGFGRRVFEGDYYVNGYGWVRQSDKYDHDGNLIGPGNYEKSLGYLSYTDSSPSGADYIEELNTLLLGGRLSEESKAILLEQLDAFTLSDNEDVAKRVVQQLIVTTPEFHSTTLDRKNGEVRNSMPSVAPSEESYKAVVYLYLFGGWDSFNVLAPYDGGTCTNLYNQYQETRGSIAMKKNELLHIDASESAQRNCDTFGVHNKIPAFRNIYNNGHGIFLANTGHLSKPVTKNNWRTETNTDLFSHSTMRDEAMLVDAFKQQAGTGVLGRMVDVLKNIGTAVKPISIRSRSVILDGHPQTGERVTILPTSGPKLLNHREFLNGPNKQEFRKPIQDLNANTKVNSGLYGSYWSQNLIDVWNGTETLKSILDQQSVANMGNSGLARGFRTITKMIASHEERQTNRDVFYISEGGFDMHSQVKSGLDGRLPNINSALQAFYEELINKNLLDKVTVIIASEFGRTLTPNTGDGSDHAWGGNYFMFGGEVKGGKILGQYPESFLEDDETNIGRGRLLPTLSWDAMWYGVAQWFGITDENDLNYVLPNNENFGCDLFSDTDLYVTGTNMIPGCGEETKNIEYQMSLFIPEPRYLTGKEQKNICDAVIGKISAATGSRTRCIIKDQRILVSYSRRQLEGPPNLSIYSQSGNRTLQGNPSFSIEFTPEVTVPADVTESETTTLMAEVAEEVVTENIVANATGTNEIEVTTQAPTLASTLAPIAAPSSSANGDPHFKSWSGELFDFHGVCDLVLLQNTGFQNGAGMHIHIRTKKFRHWSFISSVVLRIANETFEVTGGMYWFNGIASDGLVESTTTLVDTIFGYPISFRKINSKQYEFMIELGYDQTIIFKTWNNWIRVDIHGANDIDFNGSLGLLGKFPDGAKMARDKMTIIDDINEFGQEWQVFSSESGLFHDIEGPQYPQKCIIPLAAEMRRRLGESLISPNEAMVACSHVKNNDDRDSCIFDVMATNDLGVAAAY